MADLFIGYENGQKKIIPTSSEARSGNPLGSIIAVYSNIVPIGYLPCNGVAFDENQYPALYALLGDNHTPYSYDKSRLGEWEATTISTSSASPTVMPFDGFITGKLGSETANYFYLYINGTAFTIIATADAVNYRFTMPVKKGDEVYIQLVGATSISDTFAAYYTHFNVIKATSGLEETQQDYVLQSLLEADNYSTDEVATGKKWIDGKDIYRKVFYDVSLTNGLELLTGVSELIKQYGTMTNDNTIYIPFPKDAGIAFCTARLNTSTHKVVIDANNTYSGRVILEYTKAD